MFSQLTEELRNLPFVKLLFPLIFGILTGYAAGDLSDIMLVAIIILSMIVSGILLLSVQSYKRRFIAGIASYIVIYVSGIAILNQNRPADFPIYDKELLITARVTEPPEEKEKSYKATIETHNIQTPDSMILKEKHKILIYIAKDSLAESLKYGDYIIFKSKINQPESAGNPKAFDYRTFLYRKGITSQAYLSSESWVKTKKNESNLLFSAAHDFREKLISIYKEKGIEGQELAVLQALTLGEKSELNYETQRSYVVSGGMHVLAVSGLHVGIIYIILGLIFKPLDKLKTSKTAYGTILKAVLVIIFIWGFAMLSGLSPSVRRAAVMFSFFAAGKALNRPANIYNSMAASAFLLLAVNPFLITEVGFQLSYFAVFSIVFFQKKISNLIIVKQKFLSKLWELTTVSVAAQLGTGPISLFYFHIFPTWFVLTNLFIIFLSSFIVYGAALLLILSEIPYLSDAIAFILKNLVFVMNALVESVEKLPFSAIDNIHFDRIQLMLWYIIIFMFTFWLSFRHLKYLKVALSGLILVSGWSLWLNFTQQSKNELIIYNQNQVSVYQINMGEHNYLLADTSVSKQDIDFSLKNNIIAQRGAKLSRITTDTFFLTKLFKKDSVFMQAGSKRIAIISDKNQIAFTSTSKLNLDYIILKNNPYVSIDELSSLFEFKTVIFDPTNKPNRIERWIKECETLDQAYYDVNRTGALIIDL